MSFLLTAAIAACASALVGGGTHIYHQNREDKMRARYQAKIDSLQRKLEKLILKIKEKDEIIMRLTNKVAALEGQLNEESVKRDQINRMIEALYARQKKVESILHALLLLVTLRIKDWSAEKLEIRRQLENAQLQAEEVEHIISRIKEEKDLLVVQRSDAESSRDNLKTEQGALVSEIAEVTRKMEDR